MLSRVRHPFRWVAACISFLVITAFSVNAIAATTTPALTARTLDDLVLVDLKHFPVKSVTVVAEVNGGSGEVDITPNASGRAVLAFQVPEGFVGEVRVSANDLEDSTEIEATEIEAPASPVPSAPAAPTKEPVAAAATSGSSMPVGDLPGWKQVFTEDFTEAAALGSFPGSAYGDKWGVYDDGWKDTSGNGTYMPSKVLSVQDGLLDYYLRTESGQHLVSVPVAKMPDTQWGQLYGRYSVRMRADQMPGYKIAFLLWPDSETWPRDGEVDFPEVGSLDSGETFYAATHKQDTDNETDIFDTGVAATSGWHTYTMDWTPDALIYYVDGKEIGRTTEGIPNTPMHWCLQVETSIGTPAPDPNVQGHVQVDWAAAYAPS